MKERMNFFRRPWWILLALWTLTIHSQQTGQPPSLKTENQAPSKASLPTNNKDNTTLPNQAPNPAPSKDSLPTNNKDEVLEELQLFNKGIDTKESAKQPLKNKDSAPLDKTPQPEEDSKKTMAVKKPLDDSQESSTPYVEQPLIPPFQQQLNQINQEKKQKFDPKPARKQFKKLFRDYQNLIESHPLEKSIYWSLFDLIHQYIERVKNSPLYEPELITQALALLNDIADKFGESGKTARYLCRYLIANNFYPEGPQTMLKSY